MARGRHPVAAKSRLEMVSFRLSEDELAEVDRARQHQTRSDFMRQAVTTAAKREAK